MWNITLNEEPVADKNDNNKVPDQQHTTIINNKKVALFNRMPETSCLFHHLINSIQTEEQCLSDNDWP